MITRTDIQNIQEKIRPLLGKQSWGASLGHGSFITVEFGDPLLINNQQKISRGEWHLWIYLCVWYLEKDGDLIAASEDPRAKLEVAVQYLENQKLHSVTLAPPAFQTVFVFDGGIKLHTFPVSTEEDEYWMLYTPDKNVLIIGPGNSWSYESSSTVSV